MNRCVAAVAGDIVGAKTKGGLPMLTRMDDFFAYLNVDPADREIGLRMAEAYAGKSSGMADANDYRALAAVALHFRPKRIFEIGTYRGVTADFFLALLPECSVVSIAYTNPPWRWLGRRYNNSELPRKKIGSAVDASRRHRFTQLYGNSHKIDPSRYIKQHGRCDLVLVDGDHSAEGVALDTELAQELIGDDGVICWHDANPIPVLLAVRTFLEDICPLQCIATRDDYLGGVAAWSRTIEDGLKAGRGEPVASEGAGVAVQ
jgi:hypothetical protein